MKDPDTKTLMEIAGVPMDSPKVKKLIEGVMDVNQLQDLADKHLCIVHGDDGSYLTIISDKSASVDLDQLMQQTMSPDDIEKVGWSEHWSVEQQPQVREFSSGQDNDIRVRPWNAMVQDVKSWK